MNSALIAVVSLFICIAAPLSAQSCLGLPSQSRTNVRGGLATPDGSALLSARAGVLVKRVFGGVSGEYARISFFDGSISTGGADVGVEIPANSKKSVFLCPTVGASVTRLRLQYGNLCAGVDEVSLDELGLNERVRTRQLAAALHLGGAMVISPTVDLVPFASLGVLVQQLDGAATSPTTPFVESGNPFATSVDPSPNDTLACLDWGLGCSSAVDTRSPQVCCKPLRPGVVVR